MVESATVRIVERLRAEEMWGRSGREWYMLSPGERFLESAKLVGDLSRRLEDHLSRARLLRALSSIQKSGARTLLMGRRAILYGASGFSHSLIF